jgi:hypothetical protein
MYHIYELYAFWEETLVTDQIVVPYSKDDETDGEASLAPR